MVEVGGVLKGAQTAASKTVREVKQHTSAGLRYAVIFASHSGLHGSISLVCAQTLLIADQWTPSSSQHEREE